MLLVAAAGMALKSITQARRKSLPTGEMLDPALVRPLPTLLIGIVGGSKVSSKLSVLAELAKRPHRPEWPTRGRLRDGSIADY